MATNTVLLKERLQEMLAKLESFNILMKDLDSPLQSSWHRLDEVWDGYAYQEFQGAWQQTTGSFQQYMKVSTEFEQYLRQRIEALEKLDSGQI